MVFSWKRKRAAQEKLKKGEELVIPNQFLCPISLDLMKDPVTLSSGITYDRESIEAWLEGGSFTCPATNQVLRSLDQIPNHSLRRMIQDWGVANRNYGVERIPTPRVPVSGIQVSEVLLSLEDSVKSLNGLQCLELVHKIKKWGSESERNRRCVVANGAIRVLAAAFEAFARDSFESNATLLEEILSNMNWMFPFFQHSLDTEAQARLGSQDSLRCLVWFLKCRDLSAKQDSMIALKELASSDQKHAEALATIEEVNEVLFRLIKEPICPTITKASLMVIFYLLSSPPSTSTEIKSEFVKMGLLSLLLEVTVDSEKSTSETALGVFDILCDCEEGKEEASRNALTCPVLVKKILRVSELATQFSVSAIWKLSKHEKEHDVNVLVEALQVGIFQKLVLLLQLGCGGETKEKATELLKLMNPYRAGLECIDSVDFKNLKRSF
ncbi:PREDICTED: U-box domain-containing protein 21-like [Populus euphratica]|uniref:U-box domain-containing protein n=1 Tax=Populus euphratica TaxID=75702 RepID=A0AAJ6VHJ5_POPEU|nr:PREDICTED: U-box domain-containing protein 21-like [Populus euphratica]